MVRKVRVISLDVWGNARDGFEINDQHSTGTVFEWDPDGSDESLFDALIATGDMGSGIRSDRATFDYYGEQDDPKGAVFGTIERNRDGRPLVSLAWDDDSERSPMLVPRNFEG